MVHKNCRRTKGINPTKYKTSRTELSDEIRHGMVAKAENQIPVKSDTAEMSSRLSSSLDLNILGRHFTKHHGLDPARPEHATNMN